MPELFQHGRTLRRLISRWRTVSRLGTRARIAEMPSWIQPSIRADRDWDDDERQVWGFATDASNLGLATNFPAIAIFAGAREVQIRKIDFRIIVDNVAIAIAGREVNLLTPPTGYNPVALNPGVFFPFLQGNPTIPDGSSILSVPQAIVVGGHNTALMVVVINGVPVNPAIGPRFVSLHSNVISTFGDIVMDTVLDWNDPPLILPPFRVFAVQFFNPVAHAPPSEERVIANLWFSERELA